MSNITSVTQYLSNTKTDSNELYKYIGKLYKQARESISTSSTSSTSTSTTSTSTTSSLPLNDITKSFESFVKYYNNIINDNSNYSDSGLKSLTKKMKSFVTENSSELSNLGITVGNDGTLKVDETTLNTAGSNGSLSKFITDNEERKGLFYNIKKIAENLKNNNTYYLSSQAKQIVINSSSSITSTLNTQV